MKRMFSTLVLGAAVAVAPLATATPAAATHERECYDYVEVILPSGPLICIGYDYCTALICIDWPPAPE